MAAVIVTGSASTTSGSVPVRPPSFTLVNIDASDPLYLGFASTVTINNGYPIHPGESICITLIDEQDLWVIAASTVPFRIITYTE